MGFAVLFGIYYGRARLCANLGDPALARKNIIKGYLLSVFMHGLYDTCAMIGTAGMLIVLLVVVVALYILIFRTVRKEARSDQPIR